MTLGYAWLIIVTFPIWVFIVEGFVSFIYKIFKKL